MNLIEPIRKNYQEIIVNNRSYKSDLHKELFINKLELIICRLRILMKKISLSQDEYSLINEIIKNCENDINIYERN